MADEEFIPDDPMIFAGEYALRVLEGEELVEAHRRVLSDPEFAQAVEWWQGWLACMAEDVPAIAPSPAVWQAIATRIDARGDSAPSSEPVPFPPRERKGPSGWSMVLAGAGVAAMIAAAFIAMPGTDPATGPTEPAVVQPAEQLIAQLASEDGAQTLAGRIDPGSGRLALRIAGFEPAPDQSPELWVIPEGGAPISLGLIPARGSFDRDLTERERALLVRGSTIAVTIEERAGAPHQAPTPPILVAGALDEV